MEILIDWILIGANPFVPVLAFLALQQIVDCFVYLQKWHQTPPSGGREVLLLSK